VEQIDSRSGSSIKSNIDYYIVYTMGFTNAEIKNEVLGEQPAKQEAAAHEPPEAASAKPSQEVTVPEAASVKPSYEKMPPHVQETLDRAVKAQEEFLLLDQAAVDHIFDFVAQEANKHRLPLAKLAVKETRMGQTEDKVIKNGIAWYVCNQKSDNTFGLTCNLTHNLAHIISSQRGHS
jgi:hypothetical protein